MNKIVNKFLLAGDICMPKLNLNNNQDLLAVYVNHLVNIVKEFKNLEKQIKSISLKMD